MVMVPLKSKLGITRRGVKSQHRAALVSGCVECRFGIKMLLFGCYLFVCYEVDSTSVHCRNFLSLGYYLVPLSCETFLFLSLYPFVPLMCN